MQTKVYQRFIARVAEYESDLELANVLIGDFIVQTPDTQSTIAVALNSNVLTHIRLNSRINTRQSRKIVGLHLKKTLYGSFMKDIYEDFGEFIRNTLVMAALAGVDASRFVGDSRIDIKVSALLATGSWEALIRAVSDELFRSLENEKSTLKLVDKFNQKLGLGLDNAIIEAAMPYLDARHIIVHRDGRADNAYKGRYPTVVLVGGDRIKLDFLFVNEARTRICALARHIDLQVQAMNLCRNADLVP
jgi:hypothetical protein